MALRKLSMMRIVIVVALLFVAGAIAAIYAISSEFVGCQTFDSKPHGESSEYEAYVSEEFCHGYVNSDVISIFVKSKHSWHREEVFSFNPGHSDADITWRDKDTLVISIADVTRVLEKQDKYQDLTILYQIGFVH